MGNGVSSMDEYWSCAAYDFDRLWRGDGAGRIANHCRHALPGKRDGGTDGAGRAGHDAPRNLRVAGEFRCANGARGIGFRRAPWRNRRAGRRPHLGVERARIRDRGKNPGAQGPAGGARRRCQVRKDGGGVHLAPGRAVVGLGEARAHSQCEIARRNDRGGSARWCRRLRPHPAGAGAKTRARQADPRARARSRAHAERREGRAHDRSRDFRRTAGQRESLLRGERRRLAAGVSRRPRFRIVESAARAAGGDLANDGRGLDRRQAETFHRAAAALPAGARASPVDVVVVQRERGSTVRDFIRPRRSACLVEAAAAVPTSRSRKHRSNRRPCSAPNSKCQAR